MRIIPNLVSYYLNGHGTSFFRNSVLVVENQLVVLKLIRISHNTRLVHIF